MNKVQQAIDFAKQNPDSEYATELRKRIESGAMDKELSDAGLTQYVKNPQTAEPSFLGGIKQDINTRVGKVGDILNRPNTAAETLGYSTDSLKGKAVNTLEKGVQVFGQGAGAAANVIEKGVEQIPGVKQVTGAIGSGINWLATSDWSPIKHLGDEIGKSKALQEMVTLYDTDQNFKDSVDAVANIARLGGDVQMAADAVNLTKNVTNKVINNIKTSPIEPVPPTGGGAISTVSDNALAAGTELRNNIQLNIAKKSVNPQLESSVNRLIEKDPLGTYDKYINQSKKNLVDIKQNSPIEEVGGKIGDYFEKVIKERSNVGKSLGEELKTNGKIKIDITEPKNNLLTELSDSGLSYNPKTKQLTSFQGSKFAPEEITMLDEFVKGVNALGDNPSVSQIDNFISKTRTALKFTKGKTGVMGTTNAERIIDSSMNKLKGTLNPEINGNPSLQKYWELNKTYSELSDFVEEGGIFLGKKTLSGDFAKDASVAKSSVQSILNQGKKDFLIKLEELTGYKAMDDAVLALQAMKDAGDFKGLSLLQAMSETGIPSSKSGFIEKVIDYAIKKGGEVLAGTPEEQTRAFLQDLMNKSNATIKTKTPSANTGDIKNATNKINKSNISNTIPQPKLSVKGVINNIKSIPNKQGGFINIEEIAKNISTGDKNIMQAFVDAYNTGKTPSKAVMLEAQNLANTMDLKSATGTNNALAKDFTAILDIERQNVKNSILKSNGTIPENNLSTNYRGSHQIRDAVDIKSINLEKLKEEVRLLDGYISNEKLKDFNKLKRLQLNPNSEVKIYRASPVNELNSGDWVTINKTYANNIKQQNGGKVYEYTVNVSDLYLPKNIENNPSSARFSAFQYNPNK